MIPVYLGFADVLQTILSAIFDNVLGPVLKESFRLIFDLLANELSGMFKEIFFDALVCLLKVVRILNQFFDVFAGISNVMVDTGSGTQSMSFMQYLFRQSSIGTLLAYLTMIGGVLAFVFAMMATAKTISDSTLYDVEKPIGKVVTNGIRSALSFMLVPIMCIFLLHMTVALTQAVLTSFKDAAGVNSSMRMDDTIFLTVAQPAAKDSETFANVYQNASAAYVNKEQILKDFDLAKMDFMVGGTAAVLTIILMLGATLAFIRQCMDLLMLYLVSPFFSATIALDGGAKFRKWRELFVAKFLIGFGTIFSIELFLMLMPLFTSGAILFSEDVTMNNIIKLFFIMGGAWSVFKGNTLVLSILSPDAARSITESMGKITWLASRAR